MKEYWMIDGRRLVVPDEIPPTGRAISPFWTEEGGVIQPLDPKSVMTRAPSSETPTDIVAGDVSNLRVMIEEGYQTFRERQEREQRFYRDPDWDRSQPITPEEKMSLNGLSKMAPGNWGGSIDITVDDLIREAKINKPILPPKVEKPKVAPVDLPRRTFDFGEGDGKG